mmetsp:Transcript_63206/g.100347  ORF Transcript_63206/g.100347 Transcript_63206/m.100347 type:complete len:156 (+) Transcript_63206:23-490(+)
MPPDGYEHLLETQDARRVAWILALVPEKNPGLWVTVNLVMLIWSGFMLVTIFFDAKREFREEFYLSWSFATTAVWVAEVMLEVWYHKSASSCRQIFELLVAAYLTYASAVTLWKKWTHPGKDVDEELTDAIISTIAYFYASEETLRLLWHAMSAD